MTTLATPSTRLVHVGGRVRLMPYPVLRTVEFQGGVLVLLRCPVGVAAPESLVRVDADGSVRWVAEPTAWPPAHDPYVDVDVDVEVDAEVEVDVDAEATARIVATSASGWVIEVDPDTGRGTISGRRG